MADILPSLRPWPDVIFQRDFPRQLYLRALSIHSHFHTVQLFASLKLAALCMSRTHLTMLIEHLLIVSPHSEIVDMTISLTKSLPSKGLHSTGEHK